MFAWRVQGVYDVCMNTTHNELTTAKISGAIRRMKMWRFEVLALRMGGVQVRQFMDYKKGKRMPGMVTVTFYPGFQMEDVRGAMAKARAEFESMGFQVNVGFESNVLHVTEAE